MKILLLENLCLASAFKELGHDILTFSTNGGGDIKNSTTPIRIQEVLRGLPEGWFPDLVLLTDDSSLPIILELENVEIPLAWYAIDSHIHLPWHRAYSAIFDFVFVAQKDVVPEYVRDTTRQIVSWLPVFAPSVPPPALHAPKIHPLSFVGTLSPLNPGRMNLIRSIQEKFPIYLATGEWVKVFQQSKMILNQSMSNDVNFRTFEAMGSGSCLLTERVSNGLEDLFQNRIHCVMYETDNVEEILSLVDYYEAHEDERETIAQAGHREIVRAHMGIHRAQTILQEVRSGPTSEMVLLRKQRLQEIRMFLRHVYDYTSASYENRALQTTVDNENRNMFSALRDLYALLSSQL